jgi:hypothetical protein
MSWQKQVSTIAVAIAVLSGLFMALNIGIGEAVQVVVDPNDTSILGTAGLGLLRRSSNNPPFINTLITFMPVIVGLVAFTAFSTEVFEIIQGDRVWADYDDATNSYMLFLASSMVAGIVTLLKRN